jgi:glycosyltransferase involved in cell wall biosynthesis
MKIALISVAPPYRGGISKHTSILIDKLSGKHSVDLINYSRQYPDFLFPGKSQYLEEYTNNYPPEKLIDSINPISWFHTGYRLAKNKYDLIIFRFWNPFFAPALGTIAGIIKRKAPSIKLVSLCDNIFPHEETPMGQYFIEFLFHKLDGHIVQSSQTENELHKIIKTPIYEKCFHPIYSSFPEKMNKYDARKKLKIKSNNIILYFGIIREYKGFDILLEAISYLIKKRTDFHLLAAGECYGNDEKYIKLISDLDISKYVTWHNRYIPDKDVSFYFSAADVAALPYRSASQSGITQIAYSYDLPVIVTNVGGLPEIVDEGKSGFIINPENPRCLAEVLSQNLGTSTLDEMSAYIQDFKHKFSWEYFVKGIESIYNRI